MGDRNIAEHTHGARSVRRHHRKRPAGDRGKLGRHAAVSQLRRPRRPECSLGPHLLVGRDSAFFIKAVDGVGPGVGALHPRRADRHAGHPEADDLRFFFQQFQNDIARYMALDDVLANYASMARVQARENSEPAFESVEIIGRNIVCLYFETF